MKPGLFSLFLLLGLPFPVTALVAQGAEETFGCESNPTGDPIGGGPGYRDIKTRGDFTVKTPAELLAALKAAKPGQVIFVPDGVEIDLTGQRALALPAGVTLAGTRGLNGSPGARLFTTQRSTSPLFATAGNDVRLTGLRFEGPSPERDRIAENSTFLSTNEHGLDVDNCEIYQWNISGVSAGSGASSVRVHHNYIHHCQRSGYGYGVSLSASGVRIIANRFDWCRHHIASTGLPGSSYEAAYNLVLPNANGHYFDMHGGRDRGDRTDIAGDWMNVHHNTFQGDQRAVVIRGVPSQGAEIHHNWFAKPAKDTVASGGNTRVYRNQTGPDRKLEE